MKVILASASPRRKELLSLIVPEFDVIVSGVEELLKDGENLQEQVANLAYAKAKDVFDKTSGDRIVIGSDTLVAKNGKIFGKPANEDNAKQMIKALLTDDRTHDVITGLFVIVEKNGEREVYKTFDEVKVFLKSMSDDEIDKWIATGHAMDKAAAYGIQNEFCVFVEKIDGNYTSVVGLPTHKLYDIIKKYNLN